MHPTQRLLSDRRNKVLSEVQERTLASLETALVDRLATMGEDASGLYPYYARKLRHGALLSECDLSALAALRERVGKFRRVWEIGPGIGQLTAMLALDGHDVVAIDRDIRRYAAMTENLDILERHDPEARRRISTRFGSFPAVLDEKDNICDDAALVLCCTFTASKMECRAFEGAVARFALGLVDFPRLFTAATKGEEWRQRARDFAERYHVAVAPIANYQIPEEGKQGELFIVAGEGGQPRCAPLAVD